VFSIRGRGLQTSNHPSYQSQNAKKYLELDRRFKCIAGKIPAVLTSSCKSLGFPIASCHVLPKSLVKRKEISWAEREIKLWTLGSVPPYVPIFAETPLGLCHRPSCDLWRCKSSPCIWDLSSFGPGKWGAWTIQTWSCCLARYCELFKHIQNLLVSMWYDVMLAPLKALKFCVSTCFKPLSGSSELKIRAPPGSSWLTAGRLRLTFLQCVADLEVS
jgi:hypothetical protein